MLVIQLSLNSRELLHNGDETYLPILEQLHAFQRELYHYRHLSIYYALSLTFCVCKRVWDNM